MKAQYANSHNGKIAFCAVLATLALMFSYVEMLFPLSIAIPGVKIGIANIVVLVALYLFNAKYAFLVNAVRIALAGLLFTGLFGALFAFSGAMLSMFIMILLKKTGKFSIIGVSMGGGTAHNFAQVSLAAAIVENVNVFLYFPFLIISGIVSGIVIGFLADIIVRRLKKLDIFKNTPYDGDGF